MITKIELLEQRIATLEILLNVGNCNQHMCILREVKLHSVKRAVCTHYRLPLATIESKTRRAEILLPRMVAMYLMRELTTANFSQIGRYFAGRDHGTVYNAWHRIVDLLGVPGKASDELRLSVKTIRDALTVEPKKEMAGQSAPEI